MDDSDSGPVSVAMQGVVGTLLVVWLTVSVMNQLSQILRRQGYEIVPDFDEGERLMLSQATASSDIVQVNV